MARIPIVVNKTSLAAACVGTMPLFADIFTFQRFKIMKLRSLILWKADKIQI